MEKSYLMAANEQKFQILKYLEYFSIQSLPKDNIYDHRQYMDKIIPTIPDYIYSNIASIVDLIITDYNKLSTPLPLCIKVLINTIYNDQTLKKYLFHLVVFNELSWREEKMIVIKKFFKENNENSISKEKNEELIDFKKKLFYLINMWLSNHQQILLDYFKYKVESIDPAQNQEGIELYRIMYKYR